MNADGSLRSRNWLIARSRRPGDIGDSTHNLLAGSQDANLPGVLLVLKHFTEDGKKCETTAKKKIGISRGITQGESSYKFSMAKLPTKCYSLQMFFCSFSFRPFHYLFCSSGTTLSVGVLLYSGVEITWSDWSVTFHSFFWDADLSVPQRMLFS